MPRTWGYVFIAIAALIGVGALMLPLPETIEVATQEPVEQGRPRPPQPARPRPKPPSAKGKAAKPPVKAFPMQDTTKSRQLLQPKPRG